ncbi:hypothetical protein [Wenyingzhuangia sp. IMCC45467]
MKKILFLLLFFLNKTYSQVELQGDNPLPPPTCNEWIEIAKHESKQNIYVHNEIGMVYYQDREQEYFIKRYLFSKYNIITKNAGCNIDDPIICYVNESEKILNEKFGNNFLLNERKKAEKLFTNENNKSKYIDPYKIYKNELLQSPPKFIGDDSIIRNYLKTISKNILNKVPELIIDFKGEIIEIKYSNEELKYINLTRSEILKKLNSLGDWVPGYIYGKKVNSEFEISFF